MNCNQEKFVKLERLQRHEGVPMRPTPRCSPKMAEVTPTEA